MQTDKQANVCIVGAGDSARSIYQIIRLMGRQNEVVAFLEPVITVIMGFFVAIIVMSVMLPLFDLSSVAKG